MNSDGSAFKNYGYFKDCYFVYFIFRFDTGEQKELHKEGIQCYGLTIHDFSLSFNGLEFK